MMLTLIRLPYTTSICGSHKFSMFSSSAPVADATIYCYSIVNVLSLTSLEQTCIHVDDTIPLH